MPLPLLHCHCLSPENKPTSTPLAFSAESVSMPRDVFLDMYTLGVSLRVFQCGDSIGGGCFIPLHACHWRKSASGCIALGCFQCGVFLRWRGVLYFLYLLHAGGWVGVLIRISVLALGWGGGGYCGVLFVSVPAIGVGIHRGALP